MNIILIGDTKKSRNLGCQLVSHSWRKGFQEYFPDDSVTYLDLFAPYSFSNNYDMAIVNGEGAISNKINRYIYNPVKQCLNNNIPVHFTNFTYDPRIINGNRFLTTVNTEFEKRWMEIFHKCETVSVRDPISYVYLQKQGLKKVKLYPDLGFTIGNVNNKERKNRVLIGLGSITKRVGINTQKIQRVINDVVDLGYEVYLIDWPSNPESDGYFLRGLADNQKVFYKEINFQEYFKLCQTSKLNITGRHHGLVMSAAAQCPYVTFDTNMWKTEGDDFLYGPLYYFSFDNLFGELDIKEVLSNTNKNIKHLKKTYKKLSVYKWEHLLQSKESLELSEKERDRIEKYIAKVVL